MFNTRYINVKDLTEAETMSVLKLASEIGADVDGDLVRLSKDNAADVLETLMPSKAPFDGKTDICVRGFHEKSGVFITLIFSTRER